MTKTLTPKQAERAQQVDEAMETIVADYRTFYTELHEDYLAAADNTATNLAATMVHPDAVKSMLISHVAKTGAPRFKKNLPPTTHVVEGVRVNNPAYLFFMLRQHHGPYGAYKPIDSIMMARWQFGADMVEKWDRTVDVMHRLANIRKAKR